MIFFFTLNLLLSMKKNRSRQPFIPKRKFRQKVLLPVSENSVSQEEEKTITEILQKRTDAELKSLAQSPSGITEHGSETSIEDLLSKVKEKHNDVKFSIRKKNVEINAAENENWKAAYEGWCVNLKLPESL